MTSGLPGSAGRRRSSIWLVDRPGRAGGAGEDSTTPSPRLSRGRPAGRPRKPSPGKVRTVRSGATRGPNSIGPPGSPPAGWPASGSGWAAGSGSSCRCCPRRSSPSSPWAAWGPSSRRSSAAMPHRPWRPGSMPSRRPTSSPPMASSGGVRSCPSRPWPTKRSPSRHRSAGSSWSGGWRARPSSSIRTATRGGKRRGTHPPRRSGARPRARPQRTRSTSFRRPIPRARTWSSTPRARPAGRRARSTSTAASRSRLPRTWPTRSTCGPATPCAGSPTWAG